MATAFVASATNLTIERPIANRTRVRTGTVTFAADYASGGFAITAGDAGFTSLTHVIPGSITGGFMPTWNAGTGKLQVYDLTTGAEAADNLAGLDTKTCKLLFIGVV